MPQLDSCFNADDLVGVLSGRLSVVLVIWSRGDEHVVAAVEDEGDGAAVLRDDHGELVEEVERGVKAAVRCNQLERLNGAIALLKI
jgi:hypothetical protein